MIEALAELFVERIPREVARPVLARASRLLVVDACDSSYRVADLIALVERVSPVTASYLRIDAAGQAPADSGFDLVWLFVDGQSDLAYCGLYTRELSDRFHGARVETIGVGEVDGAHCAIVLTTSAVGSAPPWRRGRELARGAEQLTEQFLSPGATPC